MTRLNVRGAGAVLLAGFVATIAAGMFWNMLTPAANQPSIQRSADASEVEVGPSVEPFVLRAGWRAEEVADNLERQSIVDADVFLELVRDPAHTTSLGEDAESLLSLEGYLMPGVYEIPAGVSASYTLDLFLESFQRTITQEMRRRMREIGLTLDQVVTLASIVEREKGYYSDAPVIAGVYLNRLREGQRLEADPTVLYAIESEVGPKDGVFWAQELSIDDLAFSSPYNTYRVEGLPPGPITNPSLEAINSVLYPAESSYYYFVARQSGSHAFARTFEEHTANVWPDVVAQQTELQRLVERVMEEVDGHAGVFVKNLRSGETASLNADEFFTAASLYKLSVLTAAFQFREQGLLSFDDTLSISRDALERDNPAGRSRLGQSPTIADALDQMIIVSSNAAGETLLEELQRDAIEKVIRGLGLEDTWLTTRRLITTPQDVGRLLEAIVNGEAVGPGPSLEMLSVLLRQEINDRLPKYLPEGAVLAHKTGTLNYPSHDAGILLTSEGPVVIVVMTEGALSQEEATESISILVRHVYEFFERYLPVAAEFERANVQTCAENPFLPSQSGPLSGKILVLDPGHGGTDLGTSYTFENGAQLLEKEVALDVSLRLKERLTSAGATVYLTRCEDVALSLYYRVAFANSLAPDLLVSIDLASSDVSMADGTEAFYFANDGKVVANYVLGSFTKPALHETLNSRLPLPILGAQVDDSPLLAFSLAPSVRVSPLRLTNPSEAAALTATGTNSRRQEIAEGMFLGLQNYFEFVAAQIASLLEND